MALWINVNLRENGRVSEDDGDSSWHSTLVDFGWSGGSVLTDVHVDAYSGKATASVLHDAFGLPPHLLECLAIRLYWVCGISMREDSSELGFAQIDVERSIGRLFYRSDADRILRKFRTAAARPSTKQSIQVV